MKRIPEPRELMDDAAQALAYARADFSEPNTLFAKLFHDLAPTPFEGRLLDLGCGPADIPLQFLRGHPEMVVDAVDGAEAMLDLARKSVSGDAALSARLRLMCETLPSSRLPRENYAAVVSNSLLHHLADPMDLWRTLLDCAQRGAAILVMDLARPASVADADRLVGTYAADAPDVLRNDFRNSLFAAYTPGEVRGQLDEAGIGLRVAMVSDRHWTVSGRLPG